ncbi:MAG: type II toxin-antitoxin system HicA family toxin [Candidatus Magasanikbacteria bacterium]|nr:type II toxin-antitoxin system HicA family toxin [Candidatus Magasanikbacteria bacterium]
MPPLSQLPSDLKRKKFTKALERLGFFIDKTGGVGSHIKIIWPATQKSITVQQDLRKDVLYYLLKEIELISGVTWEQIKERL